MELEPKGPSKLLRWLLIAAGGLLIYVLGMAPMIAVAHRWEAPDSVQEALHRMNEPLEVLTSCWDPTEHLESKYRRWWSAQIGEPPYAGPLITPSTPRPGLK